MSKLRITLVKGLSGRTPDQRRTIAALGLGKVNSSRVQADTLDIRGKIAKVAHLVRVEELPEEA